MIKRLRCVVYLDDRIPEEADILDFFRLGGVRRLRSEAFRRLLLSGWMVTNQTHAMDREAQPDFAGANRKSTTKIRHGDVVGHEDRTNPHENNQRPSGDEISAVSTFQKNSDGLLYDHETTPKGSAPAKTPTDPSTHGQEGDFFGKLFGD